MARWLRVSDRVAITDLGANEEAAICELGDADAVLKATEGGDAIVHFGGAPHEMGWEAILESTIRGSYNVYEGARKNGVKRVVYASSVHAIGFHRIEDQIDARRNEAERRATAQREWLRVTLTSCTDAVVATDPEGRVRIRAPELDLHAARPGGGDEPARLRQVRAGPAARGVGARGEAT